MASILSGAIIAGTVAGTLGTGLGGIIIALVGRPRGRLLCFLLSFSAGVMLSVIFQDLLPEAFRSAATPHTLLGIGLGGLALAAAGRILAKHGTEVRGTKRLLQTGILIGLGIALHNLPEGLAIGAGYASGEKLGLSLAIALALHDIPEGMAMAAPLLGAGQSRVKVVLWTIAAGLPTGLGAFLGGLFGYLSPAALALALGFAAGAMLFLVFHELLPQAQNLGFPGTASLGAFAGVLAGIIILLAV
ncbi:MAG TPA: ZIP family metal transporter [Firmicutes bacterium]|nr:ZIP family metal transporter [Bacillota bacterium]